MRVEQTQPKESKTWSPPWGKLDGSRNDMAAILADSSQEVYFLQGYTSQLKMRDITYSHLIERPKTMQNMGTY